MKERHSVIRFAAVSSVRFLLDAIFVLPLILLALISRFFPRPIEIGLGPTPIINSFYHKQALERHGHSAEVFVDSLWYYSFGYDYAPRLLMTGPLRALVPYWLTVRAFFRYRTLYTYFDGGPLRSTNWLSYLEPILFKLAGIKTVIMAFGADVFDLSRAPTPYFVHAMAEDYPAHRFLRRRIARKIDVWTMWADHIISGVDWVYYMPYWDTLTLGHFAIDTDKVKLTVPKDVSGNRPLRVLHAPNHRTLKGSSFLIAAVEALRSEGVAIELMLIEQKPNADVLQAISDCDVVVDQLIIGWYAMFALESMALETPCVCFIDPDLEKLYIRTGLLQTGEMPLISATPESIKEVLRGFASDRSQLSNAGARGRAYVERHHSIAAIGNLFHKIQTSLLLDRS
jgi:glycosyltransferase involved in cell wall biosynthesis